MSSISRALPAKWWQMRIANLVARPGYPRMPAKQQVRAINSFKTTIVKPTTKKPKPAKVAEPHIVIIPKSAKAVVRQIRVQPKPISTPPRQEPASPKPVVASRPRSLPKPKTKPKGVRYVTKDTTPEDIVKIRDLAGRGNGRVLVIIGNGPSVTEVNTSLLHTEPLIDVMSINRPDDRVWPSRYWAFFDNSQYIRHKERWNSYNGQILTSTSVRERRRNAIQFKNLGGYGFSFDLTAGLNVGRSSVYAALQLGLWLGFEKIYVLGCDMCDVDGKLHFYGKNPDVSDENRKKSFAAEAEYYARAAELLTPEQRSRIVFCSTYNKWEFIAKYSRLDHDVAITDILDFARQLEARIK